VQRAFRETAFQLAPYRKDDISPKVVCSCTHGLSAHCTLHRMRGERRQPHVGCTHEGRGLLAGNWRRHPRGTMAAVRLPPIRQLQVKIRAHAGQKGICCATLETRRERQCTECAVVVLVEGRDG
jgi:hypothetical protein